MDQLKSHPLEAEVDKVVEDLGGDLKTMKLVQDTGTSFNFNFGEVPTYIALPTYIPTRGNVLRLEFVVGEVAAKDVGQIIFAITLDLDKERNCALRVVPRTKNEKSYQIILQTVIDVDQIRPGFAASTILLGADLAAFYRDDFLEHRTAA